MLSKLEQYLVLFIKVENLLIRMDNQKVYMINIYQYISRLMLDWNARIWHFYNLQEKHLRILNETNHVQVYIYCIHNFKYSDVSSCLYLYFDFIQMSWNTRDVNHISIIYVILHILSLICVYNFPTLPKECPFFSH